jgi:hypothetical protein
MPTMNIPYDSDDDNKYAPLRLPASGADLLEGRQYYLDDVSASDLRDRGVRCPRVVECICRRHFARRIETISTCLETGVVRTSSHIDEARPATFRYYAGRGHFEKFTLDLDALHPLRSASEKRKAGDPLGQSPINFKHITITKKTVDRKIVNDIINCLDDIL